MRMPRGMSSCASSFCTTSIARCFVSMSAMPQNWAPVQDTSPRLSGGASMRYFWNSGSCVSGLWDQS